MSLHDLRNAVVSGIQTTVPRDVRVAATPGRFDVRELQKRSVAAPAVRVSVMDIATEHLGGGLGIWATADLAAYIVTAGDRHYRADERALLLQSILLPLVNFNQWGIACEPARDVAGRNLYSSDLADKFSVALAAVTWTQSIELGADDVAPGESVRDVWVTYEPDDFAEDASKESDSHPVHEESTDG
ncbi:hypothetical protein [Salinisphaera orenii]|uniref:hypothetical protein n=1 Tax=Salinisphaera orenii TaxID=856731 RepID=UPI000DBE9C68